MRPCTCDKCQIGGEYGPGQCRLCWLFHNNPAYQELWRDVGPQATPPALPSLARQAVNFGAAVVKHIAAGCPTASSQERDRRQALCMVCEFWQDGRCTKCGCYTAAKTAWAGQTCPIGKW